MPLLKTYIYDSVIQRVVAILTKQCLWVGLTCIILEIALQRDANVCKHYHIFIVDGSFEPACVTLTCFAPQFHEFIGGF